MNYLLVDDEELALSSLVDAVKEADPECHCQICSTFAEALDSARVQPPDVAFLDIEIGGKNGIILAKMLKDFCPDIGSIFVTGYDKFAVDAFSVHANGYLLKLVTSVEIKKELVFLCGFRKKPSGKRISVKTFGGFDVFADGEIVVFKRSKAKELFAYLIDRRGNSVTTQEACSILFEDDTGKESYFRKIVSDMRKTLREVGIEDVLVKKRNSISIIPERIECDAYLFLEGDVDAVRSYRGEYMSCFSWAEFSVGKFFEEKYKM